MIAEDKREKFAFVFVNVCLALMWVRFLILLIARWSFMEPSFRLPVSLFMLFFSMWWISSVRENRRVIPLLMAEIVFLSVLLIVRKIT